VKATEARPRRILYQFAPIDGEYAKVVVEDESLASL